MSGRLEEVRRTAREVFGFEELRPEQEEAIEALLAGRDALVVIPTGSGKSAIYQIAALLLDGPTVVVSPLISLQRDQVEAIAELEPHRANSTAAGALNSTLGREERRELLARLEAREIEFLFLAPEQLGAEDTLRELRAAAPSLFVVDEAHCISEWGHDFRPDYLRLGAAVEALGRPPVLALTATAAPPVRDEIVARLGMREPRVVIRGFDRPNIELDVRRFASAAGKRDALVGDVLAAPRPGIVYVATRKHAEGIAEALRERGVGAETYHGGLRKEERARVHEAFREGRAEVVVATVAFGMGIDKADVRFVFHYDTPGSLDTYYQEIGRAGRDGEPAQARLYYAPEDLKLQRFLASGSLIDPEGVERVAELVAEAEGPLDPVELREEADLSDSRLLATLSRLEEAGALELGSGGEIVPADDAPDPKQAAEAVREREERHEAFERSRLEMMRGYAETLDCRRAYLLGYFGEPSEGGCGNCDRCREGGPGAAAPGAGREEPVFPLGGRVEHERFGPGQVVRYEEGKVVVLFDEIGYQALALDLVLENGLLEPA